MSFDIHALLQDENRILERWHVSGAHKEGSANILQRGAMDRANCTHRKPRGTPSVGDLPF
jgi:hypothetical protein